MYARLTASALALGFVSTTFSNAALAQSDEIAAVPRVATTTTSRAANCNRACLEGWVDRYFAAVIADNPSAVPLAPNVRFTENGQVLAVGEGLWKSMKSAGSYRLPVADVDAGQIALITTVIEDHADPAQGTPALLALRLKIADGRITEIEQAVERNPQTAQRVEALGSPRAAFSTPIPAPKRMSRADLVATANKYFTGMQRNDGKGDYPFHPRCDRIENGGRSTKAPEADSFDPKTARLLRPVVMPRAVHRDCCISCRGFAIAATSPSIRRTVSSRPSHSSITWPAARAASRDPTAPHTLVLRSRGREILEFFRSRTPSPDRGVPDAAAVRDARAGYGKTACRRSRT
jgi:hypothetical protein